MAETVDVRGLEVKVRRPWVAFLLALIFFPVEIPYAQSHVNKVWRLEAEEGAKRDLGMRGVAPAT